VAMAQFLLKKEKRKCLKKKILGERKKLETEGNFREQNEKFENK